VYIQEAHPVDSWQLRSNIEAKILVADPKTEEERTRVAGLCVRKLGLEFPAVVDDTDNGTERAYTGWPDRLYVVDRDGRIAFKSPPGPFGFKPDQLKAALERVLVAS
jgi:type I thyroxine 5'-deiodinase